MNHIYEQYAIIKAQIAELEAKEELLKVKILKDMSDQNLENNTIP